MISANAQNLLRWVIGNKRESRVVVVIEKRMVNVKKLKALLFHQKLKLRRRKYKATQWVWSLVRHAMAIVHILGTAIGLFLSIRTVTHSF